MLFHLDSPPAQQVELLHFRDVKNAPAIRQRILSGELNFAALNSTLVSTKNSATQNTGNYLVTTLTLVQHSRELFILPLEKIVIDIRQ